MNKLLFLAAPALAALIASTDASAQSAGKAVKPKLPAAAASARTTPGKVISPAKPFIPNCRPDANGKLRCSVAPGTTPVPVTTLTGTISVTAPPEQLQLPGFACSNIELQAVSTESTQPGNYSAPPKWIVSSKATGDFGSHTCNFSMNVTGGSSFYLHVYAMGSFNCRWGNWIGLAGTPAGAITIPLGQTQTANFSVTNLSCDPG